MSKEDFITTAYQAARAAGLPDAQARVATAQAALETNFGKSAPGNNFFGIKAGKSWNGASNNLATKEVVNGKTIGIKAAFRAYEKPADSFTDWAKTVSRRWSDVMTAPTFSSATAGLKAGQKGGYATDPDYESKLAAIDASMYGARHGTVPTPTQSRPNAGDTLIGPVTNYAGDTLIGRVPGSAPVYSLPSATYDGVPGVSIGVHPLDGVTPTYNRSIVSAVNPAAQVGFQAPQRNGYITSSPLAAPRSIPQSYNPVTSINPGAKSPGGWADMAAASKAYPNSMPGVPVASRPALSATYSGVPGVQIGVNSLDGVTPTYRVNTPKMGTPINPSILPAPTQAITPVQAVPGVGDTLIGPVSRAKTVPKDGMPGDKARGTVGRIGGSLVGGILAGPLGGIIGGMLGSYAGKTGFRDAPLSINNIGAGSQGVYGVYNGAPRGTQANTNNGGMVTSLGGGKTAYTNKGGVTTVTDAAGNNMADWSGRSYGNTKSSKK